MEELGLVVAENVSQELEDKIKAMHNHLSRIGGLLSSWRKTSLITKMTTMS